MCVQIVERISNVMENSLALIRLGKCLLLQVTKITITLPLKSFLDLRFLYSNETGLNSFKIFPIDLSNDEELDFDDDDLDDDIKPLELRSGNIFILFDVAILPN